jgi:hypothetical protein
MSVFHEEANHPFERAVIFAAQQCPFFGFDSTNLPLLVEGDLTRVLVWDHCTLL